ncbi:MAG: hypothetical protein IQL11_02220 [Bacteroidales bacterium]|nr:hypothetical protein [Bacteroidales bacterium]
MKQEEIKSKYREIIRENEVRLEKVKRKQSIVSFSRLIIFTAGIFLAVEAFGISASAGVFTLLLFTVLFLLLVRYYILLSEKIQFTENLISINKSEIIAFDEVYSGYSGGDKWKNREHDFTDDLDIFGENSLFSYLNRTVTGYGREMLAGWLSDPYALRDTIKARQDAVGELAEKLIWRQEFMAYGIGNPLEKEDVESLGKWLDEKEYILEAHAVKMAVVISPVLTTIALILAITGLVPFQIPLLLFLVNLAFTAVYLRLINRVHNMVSRKYNFLAPVGKLISVFGNGGFRSQIMTGISAKIHDNSQSAGTRIRELSRIIQAFDSRLNVLAGFILNGLILWDFQCLFRLERWKRETAVQLPLWLSALGETDALISLSNHAYNNPDYVFPTVADGEPVIEGVEIGHPLIDRNARIYNDFSIHKGQICIISGANMAGKSTFLRTVGVNLILAMSGTTVCSGKLSFRPVILFTSMRTTDSLSGNESYFYAELKRLRILKERLDSDENHFFILDEILKGTNSEDKSTGSKMFLGKLAEKSGTGLIATHDISLGEMEKEHPQVIFNKCFEVEISGETVTFDYKLRDGITRHMNAGILMRQMGII